jgi:hypothetical protein
VSGRMLYLRPGTREHFLANLARDWPELLPRYEAMYEGRAYLPKAAGDPVRRTVSSLRERHGIADRRAIRLEPKAEPQQLELVEAAASWIDVSSPASGQVDQSRGVAKGIRP